MGCDVPGHETPEGHQSAYRELMEQGKEEQHTYEALRRRILIEQSSDGIVVVDLNGGVAEANETYARMLGYSLEEVYQLHIWDWDAHFDKERLLEMLRTDNPGGRHFETQHRRKDGTFCEVEISTNGATIGDQKYSFCVCRDVSARKQMEESLRLRAEQQGAVAALGQRALAGADVQGLMDELVAAVARTLDVEFCQILEPLPDGSALRPRAGVGFAEGLMSHALVDTGSDSQAGYALLIGAPVVVEDLRTETRFRSAPLLHNHGVISGVSVPIATPDRPYGVLGAHTTRHRDFSESDIHFLESAANVLATAIQRNQADDERERLRSRMLEVNKMESVGRLAGGVAHDFNNMLGVILGHAELGIEKTKSSESALVNLLEIHKAAERSAGVTQQLLAFARRQMVMPKVLDLNETVEKTLNMLRHLIGEDINLTWLPRRNIGSVKMDPSQIDQILANLCINARDAIEGTGTIIIETAAATVDEAFCAQHADSVPGDYVRLTVSDSGFGMDREALAHLFEPFFTTKELGKGTGLGLSTVYGIVKQNNGFIYVYSEPGRGSTFRIFLPRHGGDITEDRLVTTTAAAKGNGETVLVVEDELALLELTENVLANLNYRVLTAGTPSEALREAETYAGHIDLLLTDVVMPEMQGGELAERLHTLRPGLRTLFMSGYSAEIVADRGILGRGARLIQKPFTSRDLAENVRMALEQSPAGRTEPPR